MTNTTPNSYKGYQFPAEIISHCVWLYYTFPLSYRNVEEMMLYRGIEVTYESIREWCQKFGQQYANQVRRQRPYLADKWYLDEVVITIEGKQYYRLCCKNSLRTEISYQTAYTHAATPKS